SCYIITCSLFYIYNSSMTSIFTFTFCNDPATTYIYTLSLHDALPIFERAGQPALWLRGQRIEHRLHVGGERARIPAHALARRSGDRKSTRLNSSHVKISYTVFFLKKKI